MENNEIILSICIPTYNGAKYIGYNLDIMLKQIKAKKLEKFVEIIISDNASTDNLLEVVKFYQKKHSIIKYSRNDNNLGYDGNVLKCCELAVGKYIHLMGDDDYYRKDGIIKILNIAKEDKYNIIGLSNDFYNNDTSKIFSRLDSSEDVLLKDKIFNNKNEFMFANILKMWCLSNVVIKKSSFDKIKNIKKIIKYNWWVQLYIIFLIGSKSKFFYLFNDKDPIVTIRVAVQAWQNNNSASQIYLNNLNVYNYANDLGYEKSFFNIYKEIFIKNAISDIRLYRSESFYCNMKLVCEYFKYYKTYFKFYFVFAPLILFKTPIFLVQYRDYRFCMGILGLKFKISFRKLFGINKNGK